MAGRGLAVGPPAHEPRGVAEAAAVQLLVADLADEGRIDRHPVERHLARNPTAGCPGKAALRSTAEQKALLPGMPLERRLVLTQLAEQLGAAPPAECTGNTHVLEDPVGVVQTE